MEDQGKRILLFVVIAAAIFIVFQWVSPKPKPAKKLAPSTTTSESVPSSSSRVGQPPPSAEKPPVAPVAPVADSGSAVGSAAGSGSGSGSAAVSVPPVTLAGATIDSAAPPAVEETLQIATKGIEVTFSNLGGVVKEWRVRFDPLKGRDMDEAQFLGGEPGQGLVASNFVDSSHVIPVGAAWKGERVEGSTSAVRYTYRDDVLEIVKTFTLVPDDYLLKIHVEVRSLAGDLKQQLALSLYSTKDGVTGPLWRPACHIGGTASSVAPSSLVGNRREQTGRVRFVGLARKYDLIALSPRDDGSTQMGCFRSPIEGVVGGSQVDLVYTSATLAKDKGEISKDLVLYVGPKYFDKLEDADKVAGWTTGFKSVIDLGWFAFISRPMLWLLHVLFNVFGNWGVAIILLTCLVKLATLYWTTKSMRSMKAMAALKPDMEAIQKRYPDDRQKQQQAQMELFKQHGVSPLAGCLPMLLQMPIWIALYRMLSHAGELHQARFIPGWLDDLTRPDPFFILPLTLTAMMFLQSRLQPATGDSAQQKILMYGMPLMFGGMSLFFPSGLTVYIFTNTTLGILHSLYMNRTTPAKLAAARAAVEARQASAAKVEADASKVPAAAKQAKRVVAEVTDAADDDDDSPEGSKGSANGGSQKRGARRGKRRS